MKALAAVASLAVACTAVGCHKPVNPSNLSNPGVHERALYVENPENHCKVAVDRGPALDWNYASESPEKVPGRIVYRCDGGLIVGFDKDKEIPNLPAKTPIQADGDGNINVQENSGTINVSN
jgi:hypothetical protein